MSVFLGKVGIQPGIYVFYGPYVSLQGGWSVHLMKVRAFLPWGLPSPSLDDSFLILLPSHLYICRAGARPFPGKERLCLFFWGRSGFSPASMFLMAIRFLAGWMVSTLNDGTGVFPPWGLPSPSLASSLSLSPLKIIFRQH